MNELHRNEFFTGLHCRNDEFLHKKYCCSCLSLVWSLVCHQQTPTKLKIDVIEWERPASQGCLELCLWKILWMPLPESSHPTSSAPGFLCILRPSNFKHQVLSISFRGNRPPVRQTTESAFPGMIHGPQAAALIQGGKGAGEQVSQLSPSIGETALQHILHSPSESPR